MKAESTLMSLETGEQIAFESPLLKNRNHLQCLCAFHLHVVTHKGTGSKFRVGETGFKQEQPHIFVQSFTLRAVTLGAVGSRDFDSCLDGPGIQGHTAIEEQDIRKLPPEAY